MKIYKEIFNKEIDFSIMFDWNKDDTHWLNFRIVKVAKIEEYNIFKFNNYDIGNGTSKCINFEECYEQNPLCNGFIKWDGCMEIHSLNYHFCGYDDILQRIVKTIYLGAKEILGENLNNNMANLNEIYV